MTEKEKFEMSKKISVANKFEQLVNIMELLRSEKGCPWDREQTHKSLRQFLLEETYEVLESIDNDDIDELKIELGDLLLQIVFHAQIASEEKHFNIEDILENINNKLVTRHPNVFGDLKIDSAKEQTINWEKIKMTEGKKSVIDGVPKDLPALLSAHRIQSKAATVGFDWEIINDVWKKIDEELNEFKQAVDVNNHDDIEEEFGDLLFSLVNLSRFIQVNPEDALRNTVKKFSKRFKYIEQQVSEKGKKMVDCSLEELDTIWEESKNKNL